MYNIYDTDGSLIFEQDKEKNKAKFTQVIPLKYIRASRTIEEGSESAIKDKSFEIAGNEQREFPCYVMESASASEINITEPFTFIKKDYVLEAISKLNAYLAESYTEEFSKELVSQDRINSVKAKIAAWKTSLSE